MPARQGDRSHYHHPVIAVSEEDLRKWNNLRGAPLIVEHGKDQKEPIQVGTMVDSTIQKDGSLYIVASVHDDELGATVAKQIEQGGISGFSIGYQVVPDVYGNVAEKRLQEVRSKSASALALLSFIYLTLLFKVSLVVKPFFEQAKISVCATSSDGDLYKTDSAQNSLHHLFVPMDNATNTSAPPAAAAAVPQQSTTATPKPPAATQAQPASQQESSTADIKNFAAEVELKQLREQQAKKDAEYEQEKNRAKEMEAMLKKYKEKEDAEKRAQIDAKVKELETTLKNVQQGLGLNELPKELIEDQRKVAEAQILMEDNNPYKRHVEVQASIFNQVGSALASKDQEMAKLRAELAAQKAELEEARQLTSKMQTDVKLASERIAASRDAIFRGTSSTPAATPVSTSSAPAAAAVPVQASGSGLPGYLHGSQMSDILEVPHVKPNTWEGQVYARDYNPSFGAPRNFGIYGINASSSGNDSFHAAATRRRVFFNQCSRACFSVFFDCSHTRS
jgi:phage head maturation protease